MKVPTESEWQALAEIFKNKWNFPNCAEAIDEKHVAFQASPNSDSLYFNYKGTFSIVLMALVDSRGYLVKGWQGTNLIFLFLLICLGCPKMKQLKFV